MDYKIQNTYEVTETHEFSVDWNGFNFLVIYGHHINGWFIAIPNWNVCVEACAPLEIHYNTDKLATVFGNLSRVQAIAEAIREHWEGEKK